MGELNNAGRSRWGKSSRNCFYRRTSSHHFHWHELVEWEATANWHLLIQTPPSSTQPSLLPCWPRARQPWERSARGHAFRWQMPHESTGPNRRLHSLITQAPLIRGGHFNPLLGDTDMTFLVAKRAEHGLQRLSEEWSSGHNSHRSLPAFVMSCVKNSDLLKGSLPFKWARSNNRCWF